jgi:hypothetical protein
MAHVENLVADSGRSMIVRYTNEATRVGRFGSGGTAPDPNRMVLSIASWMSFPLPDRLRDGSIYGIYAV